MTEERPTPKYTGVHKHQDMEAGYAIWVPSDWHRTDLADGRVGVIYGPYPNDYVTCFYIEKHTLDVPVRPKDFDILQKGFLEGLSQLPEVEVLTHEESIGEAAVVVLDARLTFVEDGVRRMRWSRASYWGNGQLTMVAQGATADEFRYWEPMFYNIMMTMEL
jgi:hypothetical protein